MPDHLGADFDHERVVIKQQPNAVVDNCFTFSRGVGRDQRRQWFNPFLCVWIWQGFVPDHISVLNLYTLEHLACFVCPYREYKTFGMT